MEAIAKEKDNQFDWICSSCSQKLTSLNLSQGAIVTLGESKVLYSGVICKNCFKIECNSCKGLLNNAPCRWCGGEVAPAYDDFFTKYVATQIQKKLFIAATDIFLDGKENGDLFLSNEYIAFISYNYDEVSAHYYDKTEREDLRLDDWGMGLIDRSEKRKGSFIIQYANVIKEYLDETGYNIIYKDPFNNQTLLRFTNFKPQLIQLLQRHSMGENYFDSENYKNLGISINVITPSEFIDFAFKNKSVNFIDYESLKKISLNSLYMEKLWKILENRKDKWEGQKHDFVIALASKYPELFKSEAEKYAKSYKFYNNLLAILIFAFLAGICFLIYHVLNEGSAIGAILKVAGYFFAICTGFAILTFPYLLHKNTELKRQLKKIE